MNSFLKAGGAMAILVVSGISGCIVKDCASSYIEERRYKDAQKVMLETARDLNKKLPTMLDEHTRLDSVGLEGKKIQYRNTLVQLRQDQIDPGWFAREIKPSIAMKVCTNKKTIPAIKAGYEFEYTYSDKDGNHVATVSVAKSDCAF